MADALPSTNTCHGSLGISGFAFQSTGAEGSLTTAICPITNTDMSRLPDVADFTSRLPVELKDIVLEYVPKNNLKSIRLVNKQWGEIAAARLWEHFESDFNETDTKKLFYLIIARSSFLRHVRKIVSAPSTPYGPVNINLMRVLYSLPQGSLTFFQANHDLRREVLQLLLRSQSRLQYLNFRQVHSESLSCAPLGNEIWDGLSNMRELAIDVRGREYFYQEWFNHMPRLKFLSLHNSQCSISHLSGWNLPEHARPALVGFRVMDLRLPAENEYLHDLVNLDTLRLLILRRVRNSEAFLKGLARRFREMSVQPALTDFHYTKQERIGHLEYLEEFFLSFGSLKSIEISCTEAFPLHVSCFSAHRESLMALYMDTHYRWTSHFLSNQEDYLYAWQLEQLVEACPYISELGMNLLNVTLNPDWDDLEPFHISPDPARSFHGEELANILTILSKLQNLHTLRLTSLPFTQVTATEPAVSTHIRKHVRDQFATEIMRFLIENDSPIQTLSFQLERRSSRDVISDVRREWPCEYFYRTGHIAMDYETDEHKYSVTAIPVTKKSLKKHMEPLPGICFFPETF
ncbi:hypothetical protein P154DRAFT_618068 [Amniculicola lignicola CBS 123094]|uniref:F-box domain-containing protein n=1 Tax=Amniculicola lignicola CBS 123094 TaxID=1392246 RepID=A0A6A5WMX2_9PLEO|nr:hypothetical protein P154DRAFT_618068 [Amniculicola lignicola CBS 123094]